MKTVLVWYLLTFGYNNSMVWSPPFPTAEECERVKQVRMSINKHLRISSAGYPSAGYLGSEGRCVQMTIAIPG